MTIYLLHDKSLNKLKLYQLFAYSGSTSNADTRCIHDDARRKEDKVELILAGHSEKSIVDHTRTSGY